MLIIIMIGFSIIFYCRNITYSSKNIKSYPELDNFIYLFLITYEKNKFPIYEEKFIIGKIIPSFCYFVSKLGKKNYHFFYL
jgi:hypothetical protein